MDNCEERSSATVVQSFRRYLAQYPERSSTLVDTLAAEIRDRATAANCADDYNQRIINACRDDTPENVAPYFALLLALGDAGVSGLRPSPDCRS